MQWGGTLKRWSSGPVIGTLVASACLLAIYIVIEIFSGSYAGLPHRLLKRRTFRFQLTCQALIFGAFFALLYYLPIYFQVVSKVSPAESGVRTIPLIGGASVFAAISGSIIALTGEFQPLLVLGHSLTCISCGLISTLHEGSDVAHYVGYQIIGGVGVGLSAQLAVIVCQQIVEPDDLAIANALALFFQFMGGAVFLSTAQSIFQNRLLQALSHELPEISPQVIIAAGATRLHTVLSAEQIGRGIHSYLVGLNGTFILGVSLAGFGAVVGISSVIFDRRKLKGKLGVPATSEDTV